MAKQLFLALPKDKSDCQLKGNKHTFPFINPCLVRLLEDRPNYQKLNFEGDRRTEIGNHLDMCQIDRIQLLTARSLAPINLRGDDVIVHEREIGKPFSAGD